MTTDLRTRFMSGLIFFVLIASAVLTVPARADSGSPPPAPPAPAGSTAATDVTKVPSAVTNTVGGDEQVRAVELGSQKAAYVAQPGDPVWCPSSKGAPTPGAGTCSLNYGDMASLIAYLAAHQKTADGTIWINGTDLLHPEDSSGPNTMDGSGSFATMAAHKLTLKGGWTGIGGKISSSVPSVFTTNTFSILNWGKNVTLSDVQFNNVTSDPGRGLYITTKGNISLTRVQANNDYGAGAFLDTRSGTGTVTLTNSQFNADSIHYDTNSLEVYSNNTITLTNVIVDSGHGAYLDITTASNKPVTIKASNFDNNIWKGLTVLSEGPITLTDVSASGNHGSTTYWGASLDNCLAEAIPPFNCTAPTVQPVKLTGMNIFDSNSGTGLYVKSNGTITSGSLSANNNGIYGVQLDNSGTATALPITLTGTSSFTGNVSTGLGIFSNGAITANNLFVDENGDIGATLDNANSFTAPIKVTGTNVFSNNHNMGLDIASKGVITLNNITSNGNGTTISGTTDNEGLFANNSIASTPQSITLTGTNKFNQNGGNGAEFLSVGTVSLSKVTANNNKVDGLDVSTTGTITISNLTTDNNETGTGANLGYNGTVSGNVTLNGTNTFNGNNMDGLEIYSKGTVLLNNLKAMNNVTGNGVYVDGRPSTSSSPVTLKGVNTFDGNFIDGLVIYSRGAITVSNLDASYGTFGNGAYLDNCNDTGSGCTNLSTQSVKLTGSNSFNNNNGMGLHILSMGSVTASNLTADYNGSHDAAEYGVEIDNTYGSGNVTLTGSNTFFNNYSDGLDILSNGAITTNNLTANNNNASDYGDDGVYLKNSNAATAKNVTLNGVNSFLNNSYDGLDVYSKGAITTSNLTANNNGYYGAWLDNNYSGAVGGISVKGTNIFINNRGGDGFDLISKGAVTVSNIIAKSNYYDGLYVHTTGKVTVTCGSFRDNGTSGLGYGWETDTGVPSITLIGVDSSGNFSGDFYAHGAIVTSTAHTCSLP